MSRAGCTRSTRTRAFLRGSSAGATLASTCRLRCCSASHAVQAVGRCCAVLCRSQPTSSRLLPLLTAALRGPASKSRAATPSSTRLLASPGGVNLGTTPGKSSKGYQAGGFDACNRRLLGTANQLSMLMSVGRLSVGLLASGTHRSHLYR